MTPESDSNMQGDRPLNTSIVKTYPHWACLSEAQLERAERGFSTDDAWGFDTYLAGVIAGGLRTLRSGLHSYPPQLAQADDPEGQKATEAWAAILDEMALGFEWYVEGKFTADDLAPEFVRSMELFREWFVHLWD